MIEALIPKKEVQEPPPKPEPEPKPPAEPDIPFADITALKNRIAELEKSLEKEEPETPKPKEPKPPEFPATPTGETTKVSHRNRFLEIYNRNPYKAAEYLTKHSSEIANTAKELIS